MGWGSGRDVMIDLIAVVQREVKDVAVRKRLYTSMIAIFEANDCDTLGDCRQVDPAFDGVYEELHPWREDES